MAAGERFDRGRGFLDAFVPQNAQVRLAIRGRRLAENRRPIDVPVNKKRVRIARDGEEKSAAVGSRQFAKIFVIAKRGRIGLTFFDDGFARQNKRRAAFRLLGQIGYIVRHSTTIHKIWSAGRDVFRNAEARPSELLISAIVRLDRLDVPDAGAAVHAAGRCLRAR